MTAPITIECACRFERRGRKGRLKASCQVLAAPIASGRVPRLARLMALALRFEEMLRSGQVGHLAELARLGHVSRARITQIMNLRLLATDIQEQILFLPRTERGRDPIRLGLVQPICLEADWQKQRRRWAKLLRSRNQALPAISNGQAQPAHE
jgi:hypothetical protein